MSPSATRTESDTFGPIEVAAFEWVRPYGRDELVETVSTQSSVATLEPADRADRLAAVGRLWDAEAADGALALPFRTETHRAIRL